MIKPGRPPTGCGSPESNRHITFNSKKTAKAPKRADDIQVWLTARTPSGPECLGL